MGGIDSIGNVIKNGASAHHGPSSSPTTLGLTVLPTGLVIGVLLLLCTLNRAKAIFPQHYLHTVATPINKLLEQFLYHMDNFKSSVDVYGLSSGTKSNSVARLQHRA